MGVRARWGFSRWKLFPAEAACASEKQFQPDPFFSCEKYLKPTPLSPFQGTEEIFT
jgi:hypothetical protein